MSYTAVPHAIAKLRTSAHDCRSFRARGTERVARVFISHSSRDQKPAETLKAWLVSIGFDQTFLDFDKHTGFAPGADWERTLYREIERAQAVILVLTKNWFDSKWCFAEFTQTRALGKAIFALIETPSGETSIVSSDIQHLDLTTNRQDGLDRLSRELTRVALNAQGGFPWEEGRPPYPGLLSFDAADAAIFFGRDDDVLRAIERINARRVHGGARLVAILGGSGSGKSSLLKAGVLPRLARDKTNFLVPPAFRPGSDPIYGLLGALQTIDLSLTRDDLDAVSSARDALALIDRLRHAAKAPQATLVVAVDQAEEIFTRPSRDIQSKFFKLLNALLDEDHPSLAVMTLRSDHLPDLQTAEDLTAGFEEFSLKPMPIERLGSIVKGPAEIAHLTVEDGFAVALMRDAKTQDALPLVAFVLRRLYDRHHGDGILTRAHYESLRDGEWSPLDVAVRDAATEAIARAKPSREILDALREAFVPALVRVNDEGGFVRQSARLDRLPAQANTLLRKLADARLLVINTQDGASFVEVAHEALFRVWPQLAQWLEEEREFLVGKSRIEKSREDYTALAADVRSKALLSGIMLERAKNWLIAHPQRFSGEETAFIQASVAEADRQEQERAAERERLRQAELASARAEAKRAEEQAKAAKNLLYLALAAAVLFAVLGGVAVKFWFDADAAEKQAQTNYNLALDQAADSVDLMVDNYEAGRIATSMLSALISRAQQTIENLHSDTSNAEAAQAKLLRAVSRADMILSEATLAEQNAEAELKIADRLIAKQPANPDWMELEERAQAEVGQSLYWSGDLASALQHLQTGVGTALKLVAIDPDNKDYERDLIQFYLWSGACYRNQGQIDSARGQYQKWLDLAVGLAAKQPKEIQWMREQAFAHQYLGDASMAQGKPADAAAQYQSYFTIATQLVAADPDNKLYREGLEISNERLGDALLGEGRIAEANSHYQTFLELATKLATADQSNFIWNQNLEVAHQRVGEIFMAQNQYDAALKEYRIYLQMASDTLDKDQSNGTAIFDAANAHEKIGDVLNAEKNYPDALTEFNATLGGAQKLKIKDPSNAIWRKILADSYERIGLVLEGQGDRAGALAAYQNCAAIAVPTVLWDPRDALPHDVTGLCRQKVAQLSAKP